VHDVMQQADGFCAQGRGKFCWQHLSPSGHYPDNTNSQKTPNYCFPAIMFDLDTSNG
jgi:hypothetical protein